MAVFSGRTMLLLLAFPSLIWVVLSNWHLQGASNTQSWAATEFIRSSRIGSIASSLSATQRRNQEPCMLSATVVVVADRDEPALLNTLQSLMTQSCSAAEVLVINRAGPHRPEFDAVERQMKSEFDKGVHGYRIVPSETSSTKPTPESEDAEGFFAEGGATHALAKIVKRLKGSEPEQETPVPQQTELKSPWGVRNPRRRQVLQFHSLSEPSSRAAAFNLGFARASQDLVLTLQPGDLAMPHFFQGVSRMIEISDSFNIVLSDLATAEGDPAFEPPRWTERLKWSASREGTALLRACRERRCFHDHGMFLARSVWYCAKGFRESLTLGWETWDLLERLIRLESRGGDASGAGRVRPVYVREPLLHINAPSECTQRPGLCGKMIQLLNAGLLSPQIATASALYVHNTAHDHLSRSVNVLAQHLPLLRVAYKRSLALHGMDQIHTPSSALLLALVESDVQDGVQVLKQVQSRVLQGKSGLCKEFQALLPFIAVLLHQLRGTGPATAGDLFDQCSETQPTDTPMPLALLGGVSSYNGGNAVQNDGLARETVIDKDADFGIPDGPAVAQTTRMRHLQQYSDTSAAHVAEDEWLNAKLSGSPLKPFTVWKELPSEQWRSLLQWQCQRLSSDDMLASNVTLFHVVLTSLSTKQARRMLLQRSILSVFAFNPASRVVLHMGEKVDMNSLRRLLDPIASKERIIIYLPICDQHLSHLYDFEHIYDALVARGVSSPYWYSHHTDFFRYLLLYGVGGAYFDTDVVLRRRVEHLVNVLPWETAGEYLNGACMLFRRFHPFMKSCLETIPEVYDPNEWSVIGPYLLSDRYMCPQHKPLHNTETCRAAAALVTTLPVSAFYRYSWDAASVQQFSEEPVTDEEYEQQGHETFGYHFWGRVLFREGQHVRTDLVPHRLSPMYRSLIGACIPNVRCPTILFV